MGHLCESPTLPSLIPDLQGPALTSPSGVKGPMCLSSCPPSLCTRPWAEPPGLSAPESQRLPQTSCSQSHVLLDLKGSFPLTQGPLAPKFKFPPLAPVPSPASQRCDTVFTVLASASICPSRPSQQSPGGFGPILLLCARQPSPVLGVSLGLGRGHSLQTLTSVQSLGVTPSSPSLWSPCCPLNPRSLSLAQGFRGR